MIQSSCTTQEIIWWVMGLLFELSLIRSPALGQDVDSLMGNKCIRPSFALEFVGEDMVALTTIAEIDGQLKVWISELELFRGDSANAASPAVDTAFVRGGKAVNFLNLNGFRLMKSKGRVVVHYQSLDTTACMDWKSGSEIVTAMEMSGIFISAGFLFGLGVSGTVKSYPEFAVSTAWRHSSSMSSFGEIRYSSVAAIDTISSALTEEQFFNPFATGGGVFDIDIGLMIHPWYEEYQQEIYSLIVGGGFRSFAVAGVREVLDRPRIFMGIHANILEYNRQEIQGGLNGASGYAEFGFAYDEFWRTDVDTGAGLTHPYYEPERLFFEGELEFTASGEAIPVTARLTVDIPMRHFRGGKMELNFGIVVGINPSKVAELIGSLPLIFR